MGSFTPAAGAAAENENITVSDTVITEDTTERTGETDAYAKVSEFTVKSLVLSCTARIVFNLKRTGAFGNAYGKLYKNGVAVGTQRINSTDVYAEFSEDLDLTGTGHTIELWMKRSTAGLIPTTNLFSIRGLETTIGADWEQTYP